MANLLHGDDRWLAGTPAALEPASAPAGGITSKEEEKEVELEEINDWMEDEGLPRGELSYCYVDPENGRQRAVFDLAWPNGLQEELSQPAAVLLIEDPATLARQEYKHSSCRPPEDLVKKTWQSFPTTLAKIEARHRQSREPAEATLIDARSAHQIRPRTPSARSDRSRRAQSPRRA
jgi:hypothetical protein